MDHRDLTTGEAAGLLGLPELCVRRLCQDGELPAYKLPPTGVKWRVRRSAVLAFKRDNRDAIERLRNARRAA